MTTAAEPSDNDDDELAIERAVAMAGRLLAEADSIGRDLPRRTRRQAERLRLVATRPNVADLTLALTDEVLRIEHPPRAARRFRDIVAGASLDGLPWIDRLALRAGALVAPRAPRLVMPMVAARLRRETSATIIPADPRLLAEHLARRRAAGRRLNLNRLGEAIVGDVEAQRRRDAVIELIGRPGTTNVSVKSSAIVAGINVLARDDSVARIAAALDLVLRAAGRHDVFVNVDMEEYRDLDLTTAAVRRVLDQPDLHRLEAGIVLQAYLPDSHGAARELSAWARLRVDAGGAPLHIRLVKGANLAMELVEAEQHGWNPGPYPTKAAVDASWKRLLDDLTDPTLDGAVVVGVASHNLFDVAWAIERRSQLAERGQQARLHFEMLEGMAEAQAIAVRRATGDLLMYVPVVEDDDFVAALGYLTRRLDENTTPENFLHALFDLRPGTPRFEEEAERFAAAARARHAVSTSSRRAGPAPRDPDAFSNEPDTDLTQPEQRSRLLDAVADVVLGAAEPQLDVEGVDAAVARARSAMVTWAGRAGTERTAVLAAVAEHVADHRAEVVAMLTREANKTVGEADPEVSEGIDFARYYSAGATALDRHAPGASSPLGVVVVAPPWNFAFAIAIGGVLAALAAGNAVLLKPAPQTPRTAALIARLCWEAGVPTDALQLVPVPDDDTGRHLITHPGVDAVVLTGSVDTARAFLDWKPSLRLLAETSGKNAIVVTTTADEDLAIKDLVRSAFGHAGQKCSAASLAIVEEPVLRDGTFLDRLADAVRTLRCGPANDPTTDIAPLVDPPGDALTRALTRLEPGESWLVHPTQWDPDDPRAWSPGVRIGVASGSWFHLTECFGPVLGVLAARDLDHAIELQNAVRFGLTAGLQALDPAEVRCWLERVEAGNVYVNRSTTGAIVRRQPFGGWKDSSVGPTAKAGGPGYVPVLRRWTAAAPDTSVDPLGALLSEQRDPSGLRSEANIARHRALPRGVLVRIGPDAPAGTEALAVAAARAARCSLTVSRAGDEDDDACADRVRAIRPDRVRLIGAASDELRRAVHAAGITLLEDPICSTPEVELLRWAREQSVTVTLHRHGRLLSEEQRAALLDATRR